MITYKTFFKTIELQSRERALTLARTRYNGITTKNKTAEYINSLFTGVTFTEEELQQYNNIKIHEIENMNEEEIKDIAIEQLDFLGHDVYFVDFGDKYFKYSMIVFKNNIMLKSINNYNLHNQDLNDNETTLRKRYIKKIKDKVFTLEELKEIENYKEFRNKTDYIYNSLTTSMNAISHFSNADKTGLIECKSTFHYYRNEEDKRTVNELILNLYKMHIKKYNKDMAYFREFISCELANYEAGLSGDYRHALNMNGIFIKDLSEKQLSVLNQELKEQVNFVNNNY